MVGPRLKENLVRRISRCWLRFPPGFDDCVTARHKQIASAGVSYWEVIHHSCQSQSRFWSWDTFKCLLGLLAKRIPYGSRMGKISRWHPWVTRWSNVRGIDVVWFSWCAFAYKVRHALLNTCYLLFLHLSLSMTSVTGWLSMNTSLNMHVFHSRGCCKNHLSE